MHTIIISLPGANVGCVLIVTGCITCSLPGKPVCLAAAAQRQHNLHVSNNVCFSSPLHKQNITGFCIKNSHLPLPLFFGSLLIYPVDISHCDSDVPDLAPSSSFNPSQWENFSPSVTYGFLWETFPAYKPSSSKMSAHTDTIRVYGSLLRTTLAPCYTSVLKIIIYLSSI